MSSKPHPGRVAVLLAVLASLTVVLLFVRLDGNKRQDDLPNEAPTPAPLPPSAPPLDTAGTEDKSEFIRLFNLKDGDVVSSPIAIEGEARLWYFEASFPVRIEDGNGKLLGSRFAEAQGEWMTEEFVPFRAILPFSEPTSPTGTVILNKDNPSGLPEHDAEIRVLVRFAPGTGQKASGGCVVGGCSRELCTESGEEGISTCEYRPEYACYAEARCERQTNGSCGWTPTTELVACLSEKAEIKP